MDKPTWKPHDGYSGTDLHDDYAEAWEYIEHLEGMLAERIPMTRCRRITELEEHAEELRASLSSAHRAAVILRDHITELEGMLGAGNLCEGQVVLKLGSVSDTKFREAGPVYAPFSMVADGIERRFSASMPVLIQEADGLATWRFYRKAGH